MKHLEIVDKEGRVLGLLEPGAVNLTMPHDGGWVKFALMAPLKMPASFDEAVMHADAASDFQTVEMQWVEMPLLRKNFGYEAPSHVVTYWYLMLHREPPEVMWQTKGFIDVRHVWKKSR